MKIDEDVTTTFSTNDYWEFKNDGTVSISEAGTSVIQGTYKLTDEGKKLTITAAFQGATISVPYDVKVLSSTDMTLYNEYSYTQSGKSYREVNEVTFKKK